jgi:hypothetical protein
MSTGRTRTQCVSPNYPTEQFCTVEPPFWHPQYKVAAVYPLPWGINASVNLQNLPGIPISAQYVATNAQVAPSLGRNLAACGQTAPCTATATNVVYGGPFSGSSSPPSFSGITAVSGIQLMAPFHTFEDRLNQVDARFAKTVKLGRTSVQGMFDIYNLFNASTVLFINSQYGPNWLKPSNILGGRLFKLGAQINF